MSNKSDNKIIPIITGIIGFFGGIALVNNWLVLNREYPESEYLKVPFKPEAWGNIADWAMVTITLITAIYLIKTFKSQNKAIDLQHQALLEQQKITKIEQMMFKEKVKPYFSLNVVPKNQTINNDIAFYTYSFIFLLENSSANNIQITTSLFNSENNFGE
ncbi:hypothetical protein [Sphingobacterium paucimobilis]|uniref:Uncharacterized protein n=1 Tax=Sphingobacterium paucimobilis HER1398 TaxID=1346330 RepID=U2JF65_9SPHI|nr:hypothetical protein [Sphingobacterium paucimobilis]ERJ61318.1 hypothetical protein M472_21420 [Sphingobacterium paucimobilis HER1398]